MTGPVTVQTPGALALARLASLGFPETARLLELRGPDAGTLALCALNRMEASDRSRLPGSVPVIRARYAVARRLVRLASSAPVNPPAREEMVN